MANKEIQISFQKKSPLVVGNITFLPSTDFNLTKDDLQKAYLQYNETEDVRSNCLKKLKELLSRHKTLMYRTDDDFLLRYLRYRKFNCEKAHDAVYKLYSMRMKNPEFFALMPNLESMLNVGLMSFLPYKDEGGSILIWTQLRKCNLKEMPFVSVVATYNAFSDIITMSPSAQINGFTAIWDCSGISANHIVHYIMNTENLLLFLSFFQEVHPWKMKSIILINCNLLIRIAHRIVHPLLKKKLAERVILLGSNLDELHKYVNPVLLPKKCGGILNESECSVTKHIMDNLQYLEYDRSFGFQSGK